jgi:hypothetical protein
MFINGVLCCFITVLVSSWALRDLPRKLTAHTMGRSVSSKALSGVHQLGQIRKVLTVRGSSLLAGVLVMLTGATCHAASDLGANDTSNTKIQKGGASTLQAGIAKTITRGVNLDNSNFSGLNEIHHARVVICTRLPFSMRLWMDQISPMLI